MQVKIKQFEKGNSIYFQCTFYTIRGAKVDPTSPTYSITDSDGTEVKAGTPTKSETGIYYFYYIPTSEGKYVIKFSGTINSQVVIGRNVFDIQETDTS